jgi:aspartyl-tRNA(Asn)/glutamyl-tRNA(Gln) amidotransferase subunit A
MKEMDLTSLSVAELSPLLKEGQVSPVEVTQAYLERIERLDTKLNAYITVTPELALEAARRAEAEIREGRYRGPLHGVPVAVKDQMWTKGVRTTNASTLLEDFVPDEDATVIVRLKEAGVILLGKLNMAEFASGGRFRYPYGIPRNPWNTDHLPGSSSSGSGVAVAAHLCATSLGEDTSGSIRHPSSWSGVVGLRPTWGRVSRHGLFGIIWSMDQAGPMSQTVEDCAMTLQPICGYDPKDPNTRDVPTPDFREALKGDVRGMRVGLVKELTYDPMVTPEVREATMDAVKVLEGLGARVEEVSVPLAPMARIIFYTHMYVEMPGLYYDWVRNRLEEFDYDAQVKFLTGQILPAQYYYKVQQLRQQLRVQVREVLGHYRILMSPTMRVPAPKIEPYKMPTSKEDSTALLTKGPDQTPTVPLSGVPAMSVPCGFTSEEEGGLPIGLHLIGRPFEEHVILNMAYAYEQSTTWHGRRPPI